MIAFSLWVFWSLSGIEINKKKIKKKFPENRTRNFLAWKILYFFFQHQKSEYRFLLCIFTSFYICYFMVTSFRHDIVIFFFEINIKNVIFGNSFGGYSIFFNVLVCLFGVLSEGILSWFGGWWVIGFMMLLGHLVELMIGGFRKFTKGTPQGSMVGPLQKFHQKT